MHLTKELFVIPDEGNYILYAPLKGKVMKVNAGVVGLLQNIKAGKEPEKTSVLERLVGEGIVLDHEEEEFKFPEPPKEFKPVSVTLFPTTNCNLRCIYCYSSAGEEKVNMKWETAKAAIDLIVKNALELGKDRVALSFHGGGEPLLNLDLVKKATEYYRKEARSKRLKSVVTIATNGVNSEKNILWMAKNINIIQVSFDGPRDIHDYQRPSANKLRSSYDSVFATTQILNEVKKPFSLRATITKDSCQRLEEIVSFFANSIQPQRIQLEPLHRWGRGDVILGAVPEAKEYFEFYLKAEKIANLSGVQLVTAGLKPYLTTRYCGAYGGNFVVTSNGKVTSCIVLGDEMNLNSRFFIFGEYSPDQKRFIFDAEKIENLMNRGIGNNISCQKCFAKYNCGGGCLGRAEVYQTEHLPYQDKCQILRKLAKRDLRNEALNLEIKTEAE